MQEEYYGERFRETGDLQVLFSGREDCRPGHKWEGVRTHHLLHYVLGGRGHFEGPGVAGEIGPGGAFFFGPGVPVRYQAHAQRPWTYLWAGLAGRKADAWARVAGLAGGCAVFRHAPDRILTGHFHDLLDCLRIRPPAFALRARGLMLLALARMAELTGGDGRDRAAQGHGAEDQRLRQILDFMDTHYPNRITAGKVAEHAGYERSYFSTWFRSRMGVSLQEYLVRLRMAKAEALLRSGSLSIAQVAHSVGYGDYFTFAKAFRRRFGKAPGEMRGPAAHPGSAGAAAGE